jgi:hypothetical protein
MLDLIVSPIYFYIFSFILLNDVLSTYVCVAWSINDDL